MRSIWLAVLLLASAYLATPSRAWVIDDIEKTNVIVGNGCSGTFINYEERLVLTAHHCIDGQIVEEEEKVVNPNTGEITVKKIQKRLPLTISVRKVSDFEVVGTAEHLVKIVGADKKNDIALLQVVDKDFTPPLITKLAADDFKYSRGSRIYAIGNPAVEFDTSVTEGVISHPMRTVQFGQDKFKLFQFSAGVIGGNSGGAVLSEKGELIGTVTGGLRGSLVNFAIPISFTKDLLRANGFGKMLQPVPDKAPASPTAAQSYPY